MTWMAVGAGSGQATLSGVQHQKSKRDAKRDAANRPVYEIPVEVQQGLDKSQRDALYGLPEAQKRQAVENYQTQQAYSLSQSGSRKGGLTNVAALNQGGGQFYASLGAQDAMAKERKQGQVYGQLQNMANYKDQAFQFNTVSPYFEAIAARNARDGAHAQNLSNSMQTAGSGGMGSMMGGGQAKSGATASATPPSTTPNSMYNNTGYIPSTEAPSYQPPVNNNGDGSPYDNRNTFDPNAPYGGSGGVYTV